MINWKHPLKEKPKDGERIYYIDWHWKLDIPCSFQIMGGIFKDYSDVRNEQNEWCTHDKVEEDDYHGGGSCGMDWPLDELEMTDCNHVGGWCYSTDISLPEWLLDEKS